MFELCLMLFAKAETPTSWEIAPRQQIPNWDSIQLALASAKAHK